MKGRIQINIREYPRFLKAISQFPFKEIETKRGMRRVIRNNFSIEVHHKRATGRNVLYLTEADAIIFKLKYS